MFCKHRTRSLLVGLVAVVFLLCAPTAGFAATGSELASDGLLSRGAGYGIPEGSQAVREVQRLLRRLGDGPGPIDGLYGPLTAGAVQRFQEAHALAVDGVVGPETRGRLIAEREKLRTAKLERKSPARNDRPRASPSRRQPETPAAHRWTAPSRNRPLDSRLASQRRQGRSRSSCCSWSYGGSLVGVGAGAARVAPAGSAPRMPRPVPGSVWCAQPCSRPS